VIHVVRPTIRRRRRRLSRFTFATIGIGVGAAGSSFANGAGLLTWQALVAAVAVVVVALCARHADKSTARLARELVADSRHRQARRVPRHIPADPQPDPTAHERVEG
jgi:sulfite exporter TauE/SafE